MSRRSLLWKEKLGYDSQKEAVRAGVSDARLKGYHTSQCGGSREKLESTFPANMKRKP